jgi:hypothetical protein
MLLKGLLLPNNSAKKSHRSRCYNTKIRRSTIIATMVNPTDDSIERKGK